MKIQNFKYAVFFVVTFFAAHRVVLNTGALSLLPAAVANEYNNAAEKLKEQLEENQLPAAVANEYNNAAEKLKEQLEENQLDLESIKGYLSGEFCTTTYNEEGKPNNQGKVNAFSSFCSAAELKATELRKQEAEGKSLAETNKEREEKCDEAHKNYEEAKKEAKEEQQKHMDTFNDLQEKITAEEAEIKQAEVETAEELKTLTRKSKQSVLKMRDQLDGELKKMDGQISELQNSLSQMESNIDGIYIKRQKLFLEQQKMENELFSKCYDWAEEHLLNNKKSRISNTTRHRTMGALVTASRNQINQQYQRKFDSYFNHCMRKSKNQKQKQLQQKALQIELTNLENMEKSVKNNIEQLKSQIARLQNPDKVKLMSRFKRDMQNQIQNFQADYDAYAKSFAATHEKHIKAIGDLKRKQATALHNRSQAVPQNTKDALYANQCVQAQQAFNLFSQAGQGGEGSTQQQQLYQMLQRQTSSAGQ